MSRDAWAEARLRACRASSRAIRSALIGLERLFDGVRPCCCSSSVGVGSGCLEGVRGVGSDDDNEEVEVEVEEDMVGAVLGVLRGERI